MPSQRVQKLAVFAPSLAEMRPRHKPGQGGVWAVSSRRNVLICPMSLEGGGAVEPSSLSGDDPVRRGAA